MMKKYFILFALISLSVHAYCQDVRVNINNQEATVGNDCPYRINGICVSEDIGGVDTEFIIDNGNKSDYGTPLTSLVLTNYNSFPVSVIWKVKYKYNNYTDEKSGNAVLGVNGQKKIKLYNTSTSYWTLEGLIVRKLAQ